MSQKSPFNGSNLTSKSQNIVDQSSRDLFPRTQEESIWKTSHFDLDILSRSGDIRNQSRTLQKIDRNFACFLAPKFNIFRGPTPPQFWTLSGHSTQIPAIGRGTSELWLPKKLDG